MLATNMQKAETPFKRGMVISPAPDLAGVQLDDGGMLSPDVLGPGIVEQFDMEGRVCVHWVKANISTCLDPTDVRPAGPDAHLVTVNKRGKHGEIKVTRHTVVAKIGLQSNWTVDLLPGNVIRVVRADGPAWTFGFNWILKRIDVWWPQPPDDDDAEALAVAEIAIRERL